MDWGAHSVKHEEESVKLLVLEVNHEGVPQTEPREITERPPTFVMGAIWDCFDDDPSLQMLKAVYDEGTHFEVHRG